MSPLLLFIISFLIFLIISAMGYGQIRKDFSRRYEELLGRYNFVEDGYSRVAGELDRERVRAKDLAKQVEELKLDIQDRDMILREVLPSANPTALDILVTKGLLTKRESEAKPAQGKDPLMVLVEKGRLTEDQAFEAQKLSERIAALHKV
ncbi:hypothetical protein PCS_01702 [Desulfocurvibacter africanus PCS]|uniref:Uncharacterized protein n=1 Tax=Desulfocurvibacter africanus PCS TaxID=1262666 RepID=M5Q2N4_DESAF|nr:hypothetical protein [Desulfocurvibacter africanus]EMG37563.1 hypothetical protein PCS_01702 [Desulfocurvibacter africanus PCS]